MSSEAATPATALEPLHVVLPMRTVSGGKLRLGAALDAEEREELVLGMLVHTLSVLVAWPACRHIHMVSPDPLLEAARREAGAALSVHRQLGEGLNPGIVQGLDAARAAGAASVLILPGDLPYLSAEALDELVTAADAGLAAAGGDPLVAIVPSDARNGTNALLLMPPGVIAPAFGPGSFEAHLRAAESAGTAVQVVTDSVLGFDLDTPEDLERLDPVRLRQLMELGRRTMDVVGA